MKGDFDAYIDRLQEEVDREIRRIYSEKVFQRWKSPTHVGRIKDPDACACVKGSCGDTMEIYLRVGRDRVVQVSAFTDGCGSSMVCGSMVAEMAEGKSLEEAMDLQGQDVVEALDGLPEEDLHCAFLAAATLREAVHRYLAGLREDKREPGGERMLGEAS